MPPKAGRGAVVNIKPEDLVLQCEWKDCNEVFKNENGMNAFMQHVAVHLVQHLEYCPDPGIVHERDMQCHWRECNIEVDGETSDYLRHVYFHTFHVKIKCIGALLLEKTGRQPCMFDSNNRNLIPDLPESLECGWDMCHVRFENAELFYRHVQGHADGYPDGNSVQGGCRCHWEGCSVVVKSRHKLKDHCKSHTQEKLVACPTCGALFSCRTKFFDHLSRQSGYSTGKQYQCSHCNRTFGAERILRDHMRYHVNQYKCPFCDMTSPSPSNMRLHIRYRHSDEKPYKCDSCTYKCKSLADLKKHQEKHSNDEQIDCDDPDCDYKAKNYKSLENHYRRVHEKTSICYQCHVCDASFVRGSTLTGHLKKKHKFNWPAGHSRFRYKRHSDGKFRLQTVRYESVELTTQQEDPSSSQGSSASSSNQQLCDMPDLTQPCPTESNEGDILDEEANDDDDDIDDDDDDSLTNASENEVCLISVIDASGRTESEQKARRKDWNSSSGECVLIDIHMNSPRSDLNRNNNYKASDDDDDHDDGDEEIEKPVEIRIVTNDKGEYMIENDKGKKEAVALKIQDIHESMQLEEETMYNLQMLGEVALQDKYQNVKHSKK